MLRACAKIASYFIERPAAHGKRVQALTEAKNHALVLRDCKLERTARGIVNAFCGCVGERCTALPVIVVEDAITDALVALLKKFVSEMRLGPAYEKETDMGPVVNQGHKEIVLNWIEKRLQPGSQKKAISAARWILGMGPLPSCPRIKILIVPGLAATFCCWI